MLIPALRRLTIFVAPQVKRFSSLPPHQVVGMPSLSPTMAAGTIGKWLKAEGDKVGPGNNIFLNYLFYIIILFQFLIYLFISGDSVADIETDKASMSFEAQDEYYIAKILVPSGVEVLVGHPIMITVENQDSLSSFANYSSPVAAAVAPTPAPVVAQEIVAHIVPAASSPPTPLPQPVVATAPAAPAVSSISAAPSQANEIKASAPVIATVAPNIAFNSPLAAQLSKSQVEYIKRFGRTGHIAFKLKK